MVQKWFSFGSNSFFKETYILYTKIFLSRLPRMWRTVWTANSRTEWGWAAVQVLDFFFLLLNRRSSKFRTSKIVCAVLISPKFFGLTQNFFTPLLKPHQNKNPNPKPQQPSAHFVRFAVASSFDSSNARGDGRKRCAYSFLSPTLLLMHTLRPPWRAYLDTSQSKIQLKYEYLKAKRIYVLYTLLCLFKLNSYITLHTCYIRYKNIRINKE